MDKLHNLILSGTVSLLMLYGCNELGPESSPLWEAPGYKATFESIEIPDSTILRLGYSSSLAPDGFYVEDWEAGSIYYETTLSIAPEHLRQPPFYFLSTNARQQAYAWSESSSVHSAYYRELVSERETDRFYEFRRVYKQNPKDILLSRVHKLSYLDRSNFDYFAHASLIGRLNARPIDEATVRSLAEYLWFIDYDGTRALASVPATRGDTVYCALYELRMGWGDWDMNDVAVLYRTVYAVSRSNGDVIRQRYELRRVVGRMN